MQVKSAVASMTAFIRGSTSAVGMSREGSRPTQRRESERLDSSEREEKNEAVAITNRRIREAGPP
jgi:hypothetical protein